MPEKFLCDYCLQIFPTAIMKTFFGVTSTKGLHVLFCKRWAPFFEIKQRLASLLPGFSGILFRFLRILPGYLSILPRFLEILPRFLTNQDFGGVLAPPAPPPPTQSGRHGGEGFGGLSPPTRNTKHYESVEILSIFTMSSPAAQW